MHWGGGSAAAVDGNDDEKEGVGGGPSTGGWDDFGVTARDAAGVDAPLLGPSLNQFVITTAPRSPAPTLPRCRCAGVAGEADRLAAAGVAGAAGGGSAPVAVTVGDAGMGSRGSTAMVTSSLLAAGGVCSGVSNGSESTAGT